MPVPQPTPSRPWHHLPALDGLRGVAALMVVVFHFYQNLPRPASLPARLLTQATSLGSAGVDLFFVLSGFLITGILLAARGTPHAWRNFYARRSLRIFPLYYLVLVGLSAVTLALQYDPAFLKQAWESSVQAQTRRPDEVVLVQDGPVAGELADTIDELLADCPVPTRHVVLEENRGLGPALDAGLRACSHEIVARMDSDDISAPERFERQVPLVEAGADIVGTGLWEFGRDVDDVVGRRTPPVDADEIRRVIRFRDPFNHPSVVYRKSAVQAAGGYTDLPLLEDYLLFTRMVEGGAVPGNLADPLVYYRVGDGAYARRGGVGLLRSELALQRRFRDLGLTTRREYLRNVAVRGGYRLVPEGVRKVAYRSLLANRSSATRG